MADYNSINEFAGTGAFMQVAISFKGNRPGETSTTPYLEPGNVKAEIYTPATATSGPVTTPVGLIQVNATTFRTLTVVPLGKVLRVYRETLNAYGLVDFVSLQVVTESDLDLLARQTLFVSAEAKDTALRAAGSADAAQGTAGEANTTANAASEASSIAVLRATNALTTAGSAQSLASAANTNAANANTAAANAVARSTQAVTAASNADVKATDALAKSTAAAQSALQAQIAAEVAASYVSGIEDIVENSDSAAALAINLAAPTGAELVSFGTETVADILGYNIKMGSATQLRQYFGFATRVEFTDAGVAGNFARITGTGYTDDYGVFVKDALGRWWKRQFTGAVHITWYGAVGDGVTDCSAAVAGALAYNGLRGGGAVYICEGRFRKADTSSKWVVPSRTLLYGDGEASILFHDDREDNLVRTEMMDLSVTIDVTLMNFRVLGTLQTYKNETGQKQAIVGTNVRNVRVINVTVDSVRFMAIALAYVRGGFFSGCTIRDSMRDGIRCTHSQDVKVIGCDFERVADDAVALHSFDTSTPAPCSGLIIQGCTFKQVQGIKVLGAKLTVITGNTFKRCIRLPIVVSSTYDLEGNTPIFVLDVSHNHLIDTFNNYRTTQSDCVMSLAFRNRTPQPTVPPAAAVPRPGVNASVFPYNWLNDNDVAGAVNSGAWGIKIHDNTIARTLNATGLPFSSLGYGLILDRKGGSPDQGYFDPLLTEELFSTHGIRVFGSVRGLSLQGNTFSGGGVNKSAVIIDSDDAAGVSEDLIAMGNTFTDWPGFGLDLRRTNFVSRLVNVRNNVFNMDPLYRHPDHNADNTWAANDKVLPIAVGGSGLHGIADGNHFAHCSGIIDSPTRMTWGRSNSVMWQPGPAGSGLDAPATGAVANKGVRYVPSAIKMLHVIYNGDPASPTYGSIVTLPRTSATAMPTSGTYVYGALVENPTPAVTGSAGSRYILTGWIRLRTGSEHVLNVDWCELHQLTGT